MGFGPGCASGSATSWLWVLGKVSYPSVSVFLRVVARKCEMVTGETLRIVLSIE